jgi:uncharacterized membrane protein
MNALHQVVFTGELRPGISPEQAARDFASVFKIPEEKAWRLILDNRQHVLKREVDKATAKRYREVLEELGLKVRIEPAATPVGARGTAPAAQSAPAMGGAFQAAPAAAAEPANPYAPPRADLRAPAAGGGLMAGPQPVPAGHGWLWLRDAFALFRAQPWMWLAVYAIVILINFVLNLIPLGALAWFFLAPIFAGGIMLGAREFDRHGRARVGMVFDGFSERGGQLALIALLYLLGLVVVVLGALILLSLVGAISAAGLQAMSSGDALAMAAVMAPGAILLFGLVILLMVMPLLMAYWFAPALVVLENLDAFDAMKLSFRACWLNLIPFLVFGLALLGLTVLFSIALAVAAGIPTAIAAGVVNAFGGSALSMVAAFPFGLLAIALAFGLFILAFAVVSLTQYTGYRDIFRHLG